jgi:hypothetical protein
MTATADHVLALPAVLVPGREVLVEGPRTAMAFPVDLTLVDLTPAAGVVALVPVAVFPVEPA